HRVELEVYPRLAHALVRLNECAADVAVLHQPFDERDAGLAGVAMGGGGGGGGHAEHDVGLYRVRTRQPCAQRHAQEIGMEVAALSGVARGGGGGGVGHADHDVGLYRVLTRQLRAHRHAQRIDTAVADHAVGTGEIDVLEHAERVVRFLCAPTGERAQAVAV